VDNYWDVLRLIKMWYNKNNNMSEDTQNKKEHLNAQGKKLGCWYKNFDGKFNKLAEIRDLIPRFKDFYYEKKLEDSSWTSTRMIDAFNELITPQKFFPTGDMYRRWRRHWDDEIAQKALGMKLSKIDERIVVTRNERNELLSPSDNELELGGKTLAGELMNDAMNILKNDQAKEELYDDEIIVKRRHYVLNVFNFVMRAVHTKQALLIKGQVEKRETAGFLMDIVRRSTAGKITPEEMVLLKQSFGRNQNE